MKLLSIAVPVGLGVVGAFLFLQTTCVDTTFVSEWSPSMTEEAYFLGIQPPGKYECTSTLWLFQQGQALGAVLGVAALGILLLRRR